jgi:hypothetical protein
MFWITGDDEGLRSGDQSVRGSEECTWLKRETYSLELRACATLISHLAEMGSPMADWKSFRSVTALYCPLWLLYALVRIPSNLAPLPRLDDTYLFCAQAPALITVYAWLPTWGLMACEVPHVFPASEKAELRALASHV